MNNKKLSESEYIDCIIEDEVWCIRDFTDSKTVIKDFFGIDMSYKDFTKLNDEELKKMYIGFYERRDIPVLYKELLIKNIDKFVKRLRYHNFFV